MTTVFIAGFLAGLCFCGVLSSLEKVENWWIERQATRERYERTMDTLEE